MSFDATISRKSVNASFAPNALRAASAVSRRVVQTAVSSTSGLASSAGKCDCAAQVAPTFAPMNPRRILSAMKRPPQLSPPMDRERLRQCRTCDRWGAADLRRTRSDSAGGRGELGLDSQDRLPFDRHRGATVHPNGHVPHERYPVELAIEVRI